jgi:stearoyl-CoA desaturase (delta-9 desaturase)
MWFLATASAQRTVRWWAAHHRHHHRKSDQDGDLHSPVQTSLLWSHVGWQYHSDAADHDEHVIRDFKRTFPELLVIDRFAWVSPLALVAICVMLWGWQGLVISFAWSTVACWHATFTINSLCHVWGAQPFETGDTSRNNFLLALLVMGEGWHNNHHAFQSSCRQGHTWWQFDLTWEILRLGQALGLVTQVKHPPKRAMAHWA